MTIRTGLAGLCLVFLIGVVGGAHIQQPASATDGHGGFGRPDQRGGRLLLVMPALARPELLKTFVDGSRTVFADQAPR
jgi:hypothetical protein